MILYTHILITREDKISSYWLVTNVSSQRNIVANEENGTRF